MEFLTLKARGRPRVLTGHPWVFAGEVETLLPAAADGSGVVLRDARGRVLGTGLYNGRSQLVWRRFSLAERAWDRATRSDLLDRALARRRLADGSLPAVGRLVWSEADDLPGLVVDRYGDVLVLQALTAAVDLAAGELAGQLAERTGAREVVLRLDAPVRRLEGLPLAVRTLSGERLDPFELEIDGLVYEVDVGGGQKTGFFLDQREQHLAVAKLARGRRVLDACTNQGAFALQCARAGAEYVEAVELAAGALERARANGARNGLEVTWTRANIFDWFTERKGQSEWDLIILDPPSFTRNREAVAGALRGYKELNLRALRALRAGGILCTYSCSQHVDRETFLAVLADAAADARRPVTRLALTGQPADHPVRLGVPETEYLKGAWLQVEA